MSVAPKRRSHELLGALLVVIVVAYGGIVYWAGTRETALAWVVLGLATAALIISAFLWYARRPRPASAEQGLLPSAAPVDDGFWRILVVVDDGSTSPAFRDQLLKSARGRTTKAFVVAPALSSRIDRWTGDQNAYDKASDELDATLAALNAMGVEAEGRIASPDPLEAAADGLRLFPADAIVMATHARGEAHWLEDGVVDVLRRRTHIPVTHVVVDEL
jgi:hypothetical protein